MKQVIIAFLLLSFTSVSAQQKIPLITERSELANYVGKIVTIKGIVSNTKIPTIIGVDISSDDPDLRGKTAKATGILVKWVVNSENIDVLSQNRGIGTFYRLKDINSDNDAQVIEADKQVISINTSDSSISVDNEIIDIANLESIKSIFGEPDRVKRNEFQSELTEYPLNKDDHPRSYTVKYINYYYIYDKLGLMFYSDNSYCFLNEKAEEPYMKPAVMLIKFSDKIVFDNRKPLPFMPEKSFSGAVKMNGYDFKTGVKAFPENINYTTEEFILNGVLFYPTSYTTIIDGLYSKKSSPYLIIQLDSPQNQRPAYLLAR